MEMSVRNSLPDSKADGLGSRNGDTTDITVSLSHPGKRISPIEGGSLYRLRDRKFLLEDKRRLCACALGTALLGILLMILHAELCPAVYLPVSDDGTQTTGQTRLFNKCIFFRLFIIQDTFLLL